MDDPLAVLFGCGHEIGRAHVERLGNALHRPPARRSRAGFCTRQRPGGDPGVVRELFLRAALLDAQAFDRAAEIWGRRHIGNISAACVQVHAISRMRQTIATFSGSGNVPTDRPRRGRASGLASWPGARLPCSSDRARFDQDGEHSQRRSRRVGPTLRAVDGVHPRPRTPESRARTHAYQIR